MAALSALACALTLSACSSSSRGGLLLYNGQHAQTTAALVRSFEKETGISVSVHSDDENLLADQLLAEGHRSPADVILTENSPALQFLARHGLLARVPSTVRVNIPSRFDSPAGDWVGVSARVSVMVYNTTDLRRRELPTSVMQLAEPRWRGKLAIAPSETDFQPIVTAIARAKGRRAALGWLRAIKANGSTHTYADNETVTATVNSGQAEIGLINQYYWYRLRAEDGGGKMHSAVAFFAPHDPGYVIDVSGAAVLASSRHKTDADRFLAFLVSREGQETIAHSTSFEYPLRRGVPPAAGLASLSSLAPYPITVAELGDGAAAITLMEKAGLLQ